MISRIVLLILFCIVAPIGIAQDSVSASDLVAQAISASQTVAARALDVQEADAAARAMASPKSPQIEIAPGLGFTNSNVVLGQSFDLWGSRAAHAQRLRAKVKIAQAALLKAKLEVGSEVLSAYAEYLLSNDNEANSKAYVDVVRATWKAIEKRVEIGEAPAVQLTRAEIEVRKAEQALVQASNEVLISKATVNSLLGKPASAEVASASWISSFKPGDIVKSTRSELMAAMAEVEVAKAQELEALRSSSPTVFAGVAADVWSLNRRPFQRNDVGLQLSVSLPLFDQGENRYSRHSAKAGRLAKEAELREVERLIDLEIVKARHDLNAAQTLALGYQSGILPKAQEMVQSMQVGLEQGLISFLEVLEAQKALVELHRLAVEAVRTRQLAEVRFLAATGSLPGLEMSR